MNTLKLKSIVFSLFVVALTSIFLTSCEKDYPQTDRPVEIPEETQNNANTLERFQNMTFTKMSAPIFGNSLGTATSDDLVELNGQLLVSDRGNVNGKVLVTSATNSINGIVSFDNQIISYSRDGKTVKFNPINMESLVVVSDSDKKETRLNTFDIMDNLVEQKSLKAETLSLEMQALSAYLAIFNSSPWIANLNYANDSDYFKMGCSWWQHAAVLAAGAAVASAGIYGCGVLTAGCATASVVTLGGLLVPCAVAIIACGTLARAGGAAVTAYLFSEFCT